MEGQHAAGDAAAPQLRAGDVRQRCSGVPSQVDQYRFIGWKGRPLSFAELVYLSARLISKDFTASILCFKGYIGGFF